MSLSLFDSYTFYGSYHHDVINKWIHLLFIWPILFSGLILMVSAEIHYASSIDYALLVAFVYASYYAIVEQPGYAGPLASCLVLLGYYFALHITSGLYDPKFVWNMASITFIGGWLAQFYGHAVHEGRSPALFTNLYQALLMAPLFVLLEVFFMFGYKQQFQDKAEKVINANVKAFSSKSKKDQ